MKTLVQFEMPAMTGRTHTTIQTWDNDLTPKDNHWFAQLKGEWQPDIQGPLLPNTTRFDLVVA
jgi:hypothetical protein